MPKLAELPDDVRRTVPTLAIGGSVFSPQPAARMVIVNGQVFREGDSLAAGLKLEQIRPDVGGLQHPGAGLRVALLTPPGRPAVDVTDTPALAAAARAVQASRPDR